MRSFAVTSMAIFSSFSLLLAGCAPAARPPEPRPTLEVHVSAGRCPPPERPGNFLQESLDLTLPICDPENLWRLFEGVNALKDYVRRLEASVSCYEAQSAGRQGVAP